MQEFRRPVDSAASHWRSAQHRTVLGISPPVNGTRERGQNYLTILQQLPSKITEIPKLTWLSVESIHLISNATHTRHTMQFANVSSTATFAVQDDESDGYDSFEVDRAAGTAFAPTADPHSRNDYSKKLSREQPFEPIDSTDWLTYHSWRSSLESIGQKINENSGLLCVNAGQPHTFRKFEEKGKAEVSGL